MPLRFQQPDVRTSYLYQQLFDGMNWINGKALSILLLLSLILLLLLRLLFLVPPPPPSVIRSSEGHLRLRCRDNWEPCRVERIEYTKSLIKLVSINEDTNAGGCVGIDMLGLLGRRAV